MRSGTLGILACAALVLAGCGRMGDSSWNPMRWFGSAPQTQTLEPEGGYPTTVNDGRVPLAHVTGARWEPLYEGRMLVVTGLAASKGWWDLALVTEVPMPKGRIRPDENGVLRLRLVGKPPQPDTFAAANPANPLADAATVALVIPNAVLPDLREVVISGASNSVSLRR
ncbi:hypothetical protein NM680_13355 [Paracoccus sp. PS-1]|uniref:hypothetical protein n=1 Tax=unclassified Paracoccus (in: a-proteobacteria) TaxID=2688777 RepID=UPI00056B7443|nr:MULTISPECIES: hypothetical protein [unclassified Paracoccus (in: a-proteobacteria)]MDQ7262779.1 hypothetical protein [Paracoccus sp. PS1]